jgi:type IV pilus assembly protein PilY1
MATAGSWHTYYVDFSPAVYMFNKLKDGNINTANGDKVILLFGLRRGGGLAASPTQGYYYALDVTNPHNPIYLWSISNATAGYSEMGEAWSDIALGQIKVGTASKIAAFVGAGYDNCNEDARFGPIQTYPGSCVQQPTGDGGNMTSTGGSGPLNPKGRGIYIIDVADFDANGIPQITAASGTAIWSYTNANAPTTMTFSIPGKIKPVDTNFDGYIDTLYVGDVGGNIWRFNIMDPSMSNWTANRIFSSNPGADGSTGRKIFYDPSATVQQDGTVRLYFGTGDREHPLNTAVVDRMYALIDRGQTTASAITESKMVDVTTDALQSATETQAQASSLVSQLTSTANYGWFIQLNQNAGEKVLAPALAISGDAVYTTYYPSAAASTDPCATGNLGTASVYVLDSISGNAVFNYDTTNDQTSTTNTYAKATGSSYVLMRSDREMTIGSGIPSGAVILISPSGTATAMVGIGGNIATFNLPAGGVTLPLYWRQKVERY